MRVHLVDPSAFTPPYDHALAGALARAGLDVELHTSRFLYGDTPVPDGYSIVERFYGASARPRVRGNPRARLAVKLAEHVPEMLAYRRAARRADVVHFQWLTVQPVDWALLPNSRPRVLTAHDIVPREPRPGQVAATKRLVHSMDAVIAHSEHGAGRIEDELGVPRERIRVIPHGVFDHYTRMEATPLPPELAAVDKRVILFFGLLRPYKGVDILLEAFQQVDDAELWIVGMPRMRIEPLQELAAKAPGTVRFVPRFVADQEIPAFFRRADTVVLPYREIDQSGVLHTALAFGKPLVLSRVGGFPEVPGATLVPPGDPEALAAALKNPAPPGQPPAAHSWDAIARKHVALYRELVA